LEYNSWSCQYASQGHCGGTVVTAPSTGKFALIASWNLKIDTDEGQGTSANWAVEMRCGSELSANYGWQGGSFEETRMIASNLRSVSGIRGDANPGAQTMNIGGSESFIVDANEGDVFVCEYKRTQFKCGPAHVSCFEAGGGKVWVTDTHSGRTTVMMAKVDDSTQAANGDDDAQIENVGWKAVGSVTAA
jgi:hypothetical protein